jgi:hypothetical protein
MKLYEEELSTKDKRLVVLENKLNAMGMAAIDGTHRVNLVDTTDC